MGDVVRFSRCTTIIGRLVPHLALFLQETVKQLPERASMWGRRAWSVRNDRRQPHFCSRGPDKRIVA